MTKEALSEVAGEQGTPARGDFRGHSLFGENIERTFFE
jgi:hypothetical protein